MDATLWREDVKAFAGSQDADEHYYALEASERAKHDSPFVDRTSYSNWNALAASAYLAAAAALGAVRLKERAHDPNVTSGNRMSRPDVRRGPFALGHGPGVW